MNKDKARAVWKHLKECGECRIGGHRCERYEWLRAKAGASYRWGPE